MLYAYFAGEAFSPKPLKLLICAIASSTPESFLLIVVAPLLGWNRAVISNCSVAIVVKVDEQGVHKSVNAGIAEHERREQSGTNRKVQTTKRRKGDI